MPYRRTEFRLLEILDELLMPRLRDFGMWLPAAAAPQSNDGADVESRAVSSNNNDRPRLMLHSSLTDAQFRHHSSQKRYAHSPTLTKALQRTYEKLIERHLDDLLEQFKSSTQFGGDDARADAFSDRDETARAAETETDKQQAQQARDALLERRQQDVCVRMLRACPSETQFNTPVPKLHDLPSIVHSNDASAAASAPDASVNTDASSTVSATETQPSAASASPQKNETVGAAAAASTNVPFEDQIIEQTRQEATDKLVARTHTVYADGRKETIFEPREKKQKAATVVDAGAIPKASETDSSIQPNAAQSDSVRGGALLNDVMQHSEL